MYKHIQVCRVCILLVYIQIYIRLFCIYKWGILHTLIHTHIYNWVILAYTPPQCIYHIPLSNWSIYNPTHVDRYFIQVYTHINQKQKIYVSILFQHIIQVLTYIIQIYCFCFCVSILLAYTCYEGYAYSSSI